jgi:outer membrane protein assembly factor BamB
MMLVSSLLAAALVAPAADGTLKPTDWPQWRGPNRDGVSPETGLLKAWPSAGPPLAWTAKNLGLGFGAPSVAAGKVFGIGSRDGKDGVWALKEADGSHVWFTPFADTARVGRQTNGPAGTPTYHDGKVYAVSLGGTLACLDAGSGKLLWSKNYVSDFGGRVPMWGFSESPLVDGNKVVCAPGGSKAAVVALAADTGSVIWQTPVNPVGQGNGYSSAVKATVAGVPMYVVLLGQSAGIVGVAADTGKLLWQYNKAALGGVAQIPTPIVRGDKVWFSTSYSGGAALLQLVKTGDKFTVKELKTYRKPELNNHHGGMVLVGDYVYFGHDQNQGYPVCVEFETGEIKWGPERNKDRVAGGSGSAAVTAADGRLYVRYQNGVMVLIDPSPDGLKVVSSFKLPEPDVKSFPQSWPHPVIANGKLYVRDQTVMYCYDVKAK